MKTISPDSFAMICFLVLIQNGEGLKDKSPDYITEKMVILRAGINAFSFLDIHNMRKVMSWCDRWKVQVDEKITNEMKLQEEAAISLGLEL